MGRRMRRFRDKLKDKIKEKAMDALAPKDAKEQLMRAFDGGDKPKILKSDIMMISGCEDHQTSADVSNVANFQLPDPAGRAGGACTSTLLNILYKDETTPEDDLSFVEVLQIMRGKLEDQGYSQIPQLTSSIELDLTHKFDLCPDGFSGTARAVMIGINYVGDDPGELRGCHNDVGNMKNYITNVHGFDESNITVLMDDGAHTEPTKANMLAAYKEIVAASQPGDTVFLHYSGHGSKIADDDDGEEEDGYDEVLVPKDYQQAGMIRDDDLFDIIVEGLPEGVHVVSLMDCCHSGTILDLPYKFVPGEGSSSTGGGGGGGGVPEMVLDGDFDWKRFAGDLAPKLEGFLGAFLAG